MSWKNVRLIFMREIRDQLRDRRTLFMITILPVLLYPMLGLGMVEMMMTFSAKTRTVVVLNADQLPTDPALLTSEGVDPQWMADEKREEGGLNVLLDTVDYSQLPQPSGRKPKFTSTQLIHNGKSLEQLVYQLKAATQQADDQQIEDLQDQLSTAFSESGLQALVIVPSGYADSITKLRQLSKSDSADVDQTASAQATNIPRLQVIRNSADDKSAVAFSRIKSALMRWENALRANIFEQAQLPNQLQHPARLEWVEVARGEEISANIWSKLFPAMIVIMALTGAFYPAVDLAAGEKERGTMETLLISPARRIELVMGKFLTILMFSVGTALMNLASMGMTGSHMASALSGMAGSVSLALPSGQALAWLLILLIPVSALFSALCLALSTFAKSTKEGQYYFTPLLMVVFGLTMFCLQPGIEMTPFYSVVPVVNVALLLKGMLLATAQSSGLISYAIPVLISSFGYSALALIWAIDLYNSEGVLFRAADKFDVRTWFVNLMRNKEPVPHQVHALCCFGLLMMLQYVAMTLMRPSTAENPTLMLKIVVVQQVAMIAVPAIMLGSLVTTSMKATFRLRMPRLSSMVYAALLAFLLHPLAVEVSTFMVEQGFLPPPPAGLEQMMKKAFANVSPIVSLAVIALTPAICEEIAFRGFILSGLARGGRLGIAVLFSSLMFGIVHMIPQQVFTTALLGLVLGTLAIYSRSLWPAVLFHLMNNSIAAGHGKLGGQIPDVPFVFSHDAAGTLRYESPLLWVCAGCAGVIIWSMARQIRQSEESKRATQMMTFSEPTAELAEA